MIKEILTRKEFIDNPPVLVDVGASGEIHGKWREIAKYSICIAFDADDREMSFKENTNGDFKKLVTINRIVTSENKTQVDFYLTQSPFCSSTLEPDLNKLSHWPFQDLFKVEKCIKLEAVQLSDVLKAMDLNYIDWLKIDTQGTDLRLFKSLPQPIRNKVLAAEFEPGIIDAYKGEDKLYQLIDYMSHSPFFMSDIEVKGVQRISYEAFSKLSGLNKKAVKSAHKISPGWAEVCYLNTMKDSGFDVRSYLLAYVFALVEKQYGFALEIASQGKLKSQDVFFDDLASYAARKLSHMKLSWPLSAIKNRVNKVLDVIV